jgi:hypothetical protein
VGIGDYRESTMSDIAILCIDDEIVILESLKAVS